MNKGLLFALILIYFLVILSGLVIYKSDKNSHVVDLVICRYKERLDWLDVLKEMKYLNHIYIMEKQLDPPLAPTTLGQIRVVQEHSPNNVGREGFSYVQWIIEHYYNLPDYVIFSQADPHFFKTYLGGLKHPKFFDGYQSLFGSLQCGCNVACNQTPRQHQLMKHFLKTYYGISCEATPLYDVTCSYKGQFAMPKANILMHPIEFYQDLKDFLASDLDVGYSVERLWTQFFTRPLIDDYTKRPKVLVVGAGITGLTVARILAEHDIRVQVIDKREHIGGNCHDEVNNDGLLVHKYGAHLFHTKSEKVWAFVKRFSEWDEYRHVVKSFVDGKLVPIPVNRDTVNMLMGEHLRTPQDVEEWFDERRYTGRVDSSETKCLASVGAEICEKMFFPYTRKQWGVSPRAIDASVVGRIPYYTDSREGYFTDPHQALPKNGYSSLFKNMRLHPNIKVKLGTDFAELDDNLSFNAVVYTGEIDKLLGNRFGKLPYRSLRFEFETLDREYFQNYTVVNYPGREYPYTRIIEMKHATGQTGSKTTIVREYPMSEGEPYYPFPSNEGKAKYTEHVSNLKATRYAPQIKLAGRLGTYKYLNMDQAIEEGMRTAEDVLGRIASMRPVSIRKLMKSLKK